MYPTLDELAVLLGNDPIGRRFLEKIEIGPVYVPELGPCVRWKRALDSTGYGTFHGVNLAGQKQQLPAHVWLYQRMNGVAVPAGHELDHICHDWKLCRPPKPKDCPHRACVIHVEVKTIRENRLRAATVPGENARRSERVLSGESPVWCTCAFGPHDLSDTENQYWVPKTGDLQCQEGRRGHRDAHERKKGVKHRKHKWTLQPSGGWTYTRTDA